jgi:cytochrome b561
VVTQDAKNSTLLDQPDSFGWVSIVVHWLTTIIIIALWFIGRSIAEQDSVADVDARRGLHVTVGLTVWLLLLFRIVWRLRMHHPRAKGQSLLIHRVARTIHYTMLAGIALMMISGPVMVLFNNNTVTAFALLVHRNTALAMLALVLIHLGGTLKHIIFHEDDTIVRMLWPKKRQ